ncbi:hypothetical protein COCNU_13G008180 [Cocos nucifera]|uniref:Uncharacterized protein n=1 Tax=Cocos nucifera TaxID=13894 RepID=A0A8K0IUD6_COCNU|nr:hypothetical protein COCNU_13G008180 [Cocos nucifera]
MTPAGRGGRRKTHCKNCLVRQKKTSKPAQELQSAADGPSKPAMLEMGEKYGNDISTSGCSTPKAQRFRIPEHLPCPQAPKKRRLTALHCSSQTPTISFFTPPDIDLFFLFALHDISV